MPLAHLPLRDQIGRLLHVRVLNGELRPGERIRVPALAQELRVSPTPTREALTQLERDGLVESEPNRGFFVKPLEKREALEVYPILAHLEGLALRLQPTINRAYVRELRRLNSVFRSARCPESAVEADEAWHLALVGACPNRTLLEEIARMRRRVDRYEFAYMRATGHMRNSLSGHREIIRSVEHGTVDEAVESLQRHWTLGTDFVSAWFDRVAQDIG